MRPRSHRQSHHLTHHARQAGHSTMNLSITHHQLTHAAELARTKAERYEALATIVKAMTDPANPGETPIVSLAKALHELDLCVVHRATVRQAADFVRESDDDSYDASDLLRRLESAESGQFD